MKPGVWVVLGVVIVAAWVGGRYSAEAGVSPEDAAALARQAGDRAVASYKARDLPALLGPLRDSIAHYRGRATAGARIVVRRAPLTREDTARIAAAIARRASMDPAPDTATVPLEPFQDRGITVAETLQVAPPPSVVIRRIGLVFDPDTLLVAFLRTPEGLTRVTAAATTAGVALAVADAAAIAPPVKKRGPNFGDWLGAASCVAGGWAAAKEAVGPALVAGGGCAVLLWRPKIDLWPF